MFKTCPDPVDVQDLQFKLQCKLKIFNNKELDIFPKSYSLISCASRYGLLFVGSNSFNLQVIQLKCVENYSPKDKDILNYPRRNVTLSSPPQHICVNCDSTILAVVTERDNCATVTFYDVLSFLKQNISIIKEARLSSTPGTYVKEIGWNPALPCIFTACKSDGTLGVYEIKGSSIDINELPAASEATCFCWSPKGKQIAVGSKNSRITQYKPDLKAVKVINQPPLEGPHSLISLQWVSNYQFIGIYQSVNPEGSAKLIVVDAPRTGEPVYTNYEDVCYSGSSRSPQFYMILQQHWNILMVASSNSTELGVLGSIGEAWTQWIISDSARAELPLSSDHQETLPVGLALDISSTRPLPWEESTIPPCPYLLILSHHGVLCIFNVVNLKQGIPSICTPPDPVSDLSGIQQFVTSDNTTTLQQINIPKTLAGFSITQTPPLFGAKDSPKTTLPTFSATQTSLLSQTPLFGVKDSPITIPSFSITQTPAVNQTPIFAAKTIPDAPTAPNFKIIQTLVGQTQPFNVQPPIETPKTIPTFSFAQTPSSNQAPIFGAKVLTQPLPTYATTTVGVKTIDGKPLFGQATIAPIKPQQPTMQPLFGGQTLITPIKQQPTLAASVNPAEKYSAIFSALNAPAAVPASTESKPIVISSQNIPKPAQPFQQQAMVEPHKLVQPFQPQAVVQQPKPVQPFQQQTMVQPPKSLQAMVQPKATTTPVKQAEPPKTPTNLKIKEETEVLLQQMLKDECVSLETELKALLHHGKLLNINVGSEIEKEGLVTKIESLQEFIKEIVDISIGENAEVHYLKQNLIQSWAWYEEARSRYNASKDETVSLLLRSQPLDSATEKKQADIRKMMYYIESQITQASKALDEQWDNFQDYAKKVHRTKMPTMESIFQAMVRQNAILQKQTYVLKDIAGRLKKSKSGATNLPSLLLSIDTTKDLEESLDRLKIDQSQDVYQMQYERVLNRMKSLSEIRTNKLRNLLKNREVLHVTAVKPQLSSSLMLQSPESKTKRLLSNLAALGTPIASPSEKLPIPKALSFVHSTPIHAAKTDIKPTETPPNTPQIDAKTFTFKKVEKNYLAASLPTSNSFIPLSKSASLLTNMPQEVLPQALTTHSPSAFVPTQVNFGGGNKLFNFTGATTTPAKTTTPSIVPMATTATTFSFGGSSSTLPKFGVPSVSKTAETTAIATSTAQSIAQFSFGSGLTITPISTAKKDVTTTTSAPLFGIPSTAKATFSFGGTSSFFGPKTTAETSASQTSVVAANSNLFSNSTLGPGKPLIGVASGTLGTSDSTSKLSAFSAVPTNVSSLSLPTTTANSTTKSEDSIITKPFIFSNSSVADGGLIKSPTPSSSTSLTTTITAAAIKPSFGFTVTATPIFGNTTLTTTSASPGVVSSSSIFGNTAATPISPSLPSTPPSAPTEFISSASSGFSTPTAIKHSFPFGNSTTTVTVATVPGNISTLTVTTATSTKPSPLVTPSTAAATSNQSLISEATQSTTSSSVAPKTSTTPSSTAKPLFGNVTPSQPSVFAVSSTSTPLSVLSQVSGDTVTTQNVPVFSSSGTAANSTMQSVPLFGTSNTTPTVQPSIFGGTQITTSGATTTQSIPALGSSKTTTSSQSIFSTVTTSAQPSIFGGIQNATSPASSTAETTSIFGSTTTGSSTQAPLFGAVPSSATPSIFASTAIGKTTAPSIFGTVSTTTTQSSIFGAPAASTATTMQSMFATTAVSNQPSLFGTNTSTSSQQGSIFGSTTSTSPTSIFGSGSGTAPAQTSIFGGAKPDSTSNSSIFGGSQPTTTQSSVFAVGSTPTQTSVFGSPSTSSASPFGFGSTSAPFGQTSSVFGASKTTASAFGTGFGSPGGFNTTASTTSSVFGQSASFGSSAPVFGTPTTATNVFGSPAAAFGANTSASVFGTPPVSSSSSFSFANAAGNTTNTGAFGFGSLNVGNSPTASSPFGGTGGSTFGQTPAANPFNRPAEPKSPFGGGNTSVFGNPASTSGSIFGSNTGSTFSSNAQSGFGTSTFGTPSTFGQQSTFGQSSFGNTSFGSTQPGPFSGGSGAVAQTGFGSPSSFAKPSGFGASPVFGGSPQSAFGAAPSFGGAPAFGATPAFGSPNKVFGSNTGTAAFGPTTNTGFGNLAQQSTVGFGNLAQQAASPNSAPFSSSSSFSSWR